MLGFGGVTPIDTSVAGVTVRDAAPDTLPLAAVIVTDPVPMLVAKPFDPEALLMDTTLVFEDVQATVAVRFWVELSV